MIMKVYVVDAFTDTIFSGNPAAVCPMSEWLPDELMQMMAFEHNLAETVFIVNEGEHYKIRWFTPETEVPLCGHATLAAAHVLFHHMGHTGDEIVFDSLSGILKVAKNENGLTLNFPINIMKPVEIDEEVKKCFSKQPVEVLTGIMDYMFVYETQEDIENMIPNLAEIAKIDTRGIIITAPGNEVDMVSRFFAPQSGIDEDPVTGSAHTSLTPYWAEKLGKTRLTALQLSERGGKLFCELAGDRVLISGQAVTYMIGDIQL